MDPAIAKCIWDMLRVRMMEAKFRDFPALLIVAAALEQDEIGWLDFTEGATCLGTVEGGSGSL